MSTIDRYRVRGGNQEWDNPGPDLLRVRSNAKGHLRAVIGDRHDRLYVRKKDPEATKWRGPIRKREVMDAFDGWGSLTDVFQVGRDKGTAGGDITLIAAVKRVDVQLEILENCSAGTISAHSLIQEQFPPVGFCGGYNYRQIAGSSSWSDHAWGTAIDECQHPPEAPNDEVFDWVSRMGASRNMTFDYALGSRNGQVMATVAPDFTPHPSSAADSHLTHVHVSIIDHDGSRPPHEGGVF